MGIEPIALQNRPKLEKKLLYFRSVFVELSDSRAYSQYGQPLPIPISEYVAYCEMFEIRSLAERERLFHMVRAQDRAYVQHMSKKMKADLDKKTNTAVAPK